MKKLLLVAGVAVLAFAGWRLWPRHEAEVASDARLLTDRLWIDHMPRNERDTIQAFAMLTEQPVGVFQAASVWAGSYELFRYEGKGDEVRATFPQTGNKEKFRAKARKCDERGMDFCLEISGSDHGSKRYYSREGWEIGSVEAEKQLIEQLEKSAPAE